MAGRYTYSPYEVDPYEYQHAGAMQSGSRRFFSAVGRFFYRLIVLTLIVGALGGALFALYRNDVLLSIARGAGVEAQYRSLEQRIGAPGWGTPRSIDVPAETPVAPAADKDTADKQPETMRAAATSGSSDSTPDGLPIVSFDSLPTAPSKKAAPEAISLSALPAEPARRERVEPTRTARAEPAPRQRAKAQKAESAEPAPVTRSIPLPKAPPKPEPVAKAEPEPKPEPPAPKPAPEVDRTKPRANDNPLKAAIRAAMADKKASE
jgi:hypothetical protein